MSNLELADECAGCGCPTRCAEGAMDAMRVALDEREETIHQQAAKIHRLQCEVEDRIADIKRAWAELHNIAEVLKAEAVSRFDAHGSQDQRGAALWDAAAAIREGRLGA